MMKKLAIVLVLPLATVLAFAGRAEARSAGINGRAQAGCGGFGCHGATDGSPSPGASVTITTLPIGPIAPGAGVDVTVSVNGPPPDPVHVNQGGFDMSVSRGSFTLLDGSTRSWGPQETGHSAAGNDQRSWTVEWNPPGTIPTLCGFSFFASANAVNGDGVASGADHWNRASATLDVDSSGDAAPPAGEFARPVAGESYLFDNAVASPTSTVVVASITLDVHVTDDVGIAGVLFRDEDLSGTQTIGAASWAGVRDGANSFRRFWDVSLEVPGPHTVTAVITDCKGNQSTITTEIFVL